jgi:NADPH:quinone reductase-like Zn-dependent oxidoreductase
MLTLSFVGHDPTETLADKMCVMHNAVQTYPAGRRAAVLSDFGEADDLSIRELPTPTFRSDEMLVRVKATSVNPIEWNMPGGLALPKPVWRLLIGRPMILGIDFSGTVVAVGSHVSAIKSVTT